MKKDFLYLKKSRWLLLTLLAILVGASPTWADELTVHEGTNTNSYIPFYSYYADKAGTKGEFIVPAAELADIIGKNITQLQFYTNSDQNLTGTFKVFMREVENETLTEYIDLDENSTVVYSGSLSTTSQIMTIELEDVFSYNGGNLLIGFLVETAGNSPSMSFYGTTTSSNTAWYYYVGYKTYSQAATFIPKTTFTYEASSSIKRPKSLNASKIKSSTATASWTAGGSETSWEINYGTDSTEPSEDGSYITVESPSYDLTGLTPSTTYYFFVRAIDGENHSKWSSVSFTTTEVATSADESYTDDFETANNWNLINGTLTNAWAWGEATNNGGSKALYISNDGGTTYAYTPGAGNTMVYASKLFSFEGGTYVFKYDWKANGESKYDYLRVALVPASVTLTAGTTVPSGFSDSALPTGWTAIDGGSKLNLQTSWQSVSQDIAVAEGSYYVVFAWRNDGSGGTSPAAAIDNFSISVQNCPTPTELAVSDITAHEGTLTWATSSNTWEVYCSTSSETPAADVEGATAVNTNSYTFTGLTGETKYYVWVRSVSGSDKSDWAGTNFTTLVSCPAPTGFAFSKSGTTATVTWTAGGEEASWEFVYSDNSSANPDELSATVVNTTASYIMTDLTAETTYYVWVRAKTADEHSAWLSGSFTLAYASPAPTSVDGSGITNVTFGSNGLIVNNSNRPTAKPYYGNYSSQVGAIPAGTTAAVDITFATGYTYGTVIFVDWNNNYEFEESEAVYKGTSASTNPTTLNATFDIDANQALGDYRMRIVSADSYYDNYISGSASYTSALSCPTGTYTVAHDYTLRVITPPSCATPTGLTASNVAARSVDLSWTVGDEEQDAWQIVYNTDADFDPAAATPVAAGTNPFTLTGLTPETTYYAYVRAYCSESDQSAWSNKISFTTQPSCITPTALTATSIGSTTATLSWTDETEQMKWEVSYSTTSGAPADGTIVAVTEKTYTITGLTAGTTYYTSVRAVNSDEDKSAWSDEISFTPGVLTVNDGTTTNALIPIYGNYANYLTKSQVIIPAETLSSIANNRINKLVFYNNQSSRDWGSAKFDIYLNEVENTSFSSTTLESWDNMEKVYSGSLTVSANQMVIEFTDPYDYQGGNLMIGVNQTTAGSSAGIGWYGISGTYTAVGGYGSTSNFGRQNFLPKMSVYYTAIPVAPRMVVDTTPVNFGLVEANSTQTATFTIENRKGTATLEGINVSCTDGAFSVSEVNNASIAVNGDAITVTVTFDTTTPGSYNGTITVSATGQENATVNVSGTVMDPEKVYESGFVSLPTDWTTDGTWYYSETNGAYTTAWYIDPSQGSIARLKTPKLTISEGETFIVEAKGYSTSNTSYQHLQMQYSADGSTWTNFDSEPTLDPSNWKAFSFTFPEGISGDYYIGILASQADIRMFYGGQLPNEPKMVVTQPTSLDYGIIDKATAKTFTIANTGKAELKGINVVSSNAAFTITGAPTTLAAGASAEVTITMSAVTAGVLSSAITVSATNMENVVFTVNGVVLPAGMPVEDFSGTTIPANWTSSGSWTFTTDGIASGKSSSAYLMTPKLTFSEGDFLVIRMAPNDTYSGDYLAIEGSSNNGSSYGAYYKKIEVPQGKDVYANYIVSDIPTTINKIRFVGYYVDVDEIYGLTYAPELKVTDKDETVVASGLAYDFGECAANESVTYNFANAGAGTINITNVEITGDGAAAYSTNWTESVAAPFDLTITRSYDADRTEAQEAVVTVTTSEGEFVINVTGTDKAANAPELAVTLGGEAVTTGDAANFGSQLQAAPAAKTYTITNSGTGTLTGTIATSDDTQFTVSKTEFSLGAAESTTFDLALVYNTTYGAKAATITIHPTVDGLEDIVINATASTLDPEAWTEDFSAGTLPTGWTQGTWTIGTYSNYENTTTMALAPSSSTAGTIITPCLTAKKDEVLTWDAYFKWADEPLIVEYSNDDKQSWNAITTVYGTESGEKGSGQVNYHKDLSFTAPVDGDYYLRFTSTYSNGVDNFAGFKLNLPDHIMAITASNIPTSGSYSPTMKATKSFEATVTVQESRGVDEENVVAKLYMGEEVIGTSETTTVEANATKQITITATPTVAAIEGAEMHIEVEWAGTTLTTEAVTRYVAEFVKLDLTETAEKDIETGYSAVYDQVTLTRSFAAGWNTFVAPVAVNMSEFDEGAKAYTFSGYAEGILRFTAITTTLNPATPYIIYVPEKIDEKVFTWDEPVIYSSYVGTDNIKTTQNDATFQGTYAPMEAGTMTGLWGVTKEAKIAKGTAEASMKGFRAYFELPSGANAARLAFTDEDGTTTVIKAIELDKQNGEVYNLNGQRVENMKKGNLYIINGKKQIRR